MSRTTDGATITVALLGNPNTGKSTLFSALVGVPQRVGNYPGVTVEKKLGQTTFAGCRFTVIDLPGTYSLAPRSPDEMVAVDVLLGRRQDVPHPAIIICIVDASNLERNLYLVSQALELGLPLIIALNKTDIARERKIALNVARLRQRLAVPVIEMEAHRRIGLDELKQAMVTAYGGDPPTCESPFPDVFCQEVARLKLMCDQHSRHSVPRYMIERLLLDTGGYLEQSVTARDDQLPPGELQQARLRLKLAGCPVPTVETMSRFGWVQKILDGVQESSGDDRVSLTDKIDRIVTHRVAGGLIFFLLMVVVFQSIFSWAAPFQDAIEQGVSHLGNWIESIVPGGVLQSLLADGVVAGVGAVLVFLPQIAMLFFFVAILEDCGYMARAAYLMDGLMSRVGLSGKSFIPLLSSFACAVPGILAARVIESRRDRLVTILVAPLMSCSARLPVYTLMIAAFIPNRRFLGGWLGLQGITIFALYGLGIVVAICVAKILRKTILKGDTPPFLMELPDYRLPSPRNVVARVSEQCWVFIRGAGTLILAVTVIVWAAAYFPHPESVETQVRGRFTQQLALVQQNIETIRSDEEAAEVSGERWERLAEFERQQVDLESAIADQVAGAYMEQSILGRLGKLIAPVVRPLGWDWRIGCAVIASFPAREVVIGAMGVIYDLGEGQDEQSSSLKEELIAQQWPGTNRPVFTIPAALSIMVFFALCAQCAATLVTIYKETGSRRWPLFTFAYMTVLAYAGALITYQVGTWLS